MAQGKLSVTEKYAIQGMLHQKKTIAEIAVALARSEGVVKKYVDNELSSLQDTIAKVQMDAVVPDVEEPKFKLSEELYEEVIHKLRTAGLYREDAKEILDRTLGKLTFQPENSQQVYVLCIRNLNAKDVMNTRTASGKKGVAIMNAAASERGDESRKKAKPESRSARGNVYKPKG